VRLHVEARREAPDRKRVTAADCHSVFERNNQRRCRDRAARLHSKAEHGTRRSGVGWRIERDDGRFGLQALEFAVLVPDPDSSRVRTPRRAEADLDARGRSIDQADGGFEIDRRRPGTDEGCGALGYERTVGWWLRRNDDRERHGCGTRAHQLCGEWRWYGEPKGNHSQRGHDAPIRGAHMEPYRQNGTPKLSGCTPSRETQITFQL